jgi:hypothetical protein
LNFLHSRKSRSNLFNFRAQNNDGGNGRCSLRVLQQGQGFKTLALSLSTETSDWAGLNPPASVVTALIDWARTCSCVGWCWRGCRSRCLLLAHPLASRRRFLRGFQQGQGFKPLALSLSTEATVVCRLQIGQDLTLLRLMRH